MEVVIRLTMTEKIMMAASDSMGTEERQAISQQLVQLVEEINEIAQQTEKVKYAKHIIQSLS